MHAFPFKESHVNIYNVYILTPIINFFYSFCDNNYYFLLFQKLNLKKNETKSREWRTYHGEVVGRNLLMDGTFDTWEEATQKLTNATKT